MNKKIHALLWGAFSTGGFVAAFLLPSFIILNSILFHPSGIISSDPISYENAIIRFNNPLFKMYLIVLFSTTLIHGLYRFKAFLFEVGFLPYKKPITGLVYLIISIGTASTLFFVLSSLF